jgi:hypothetical protein
MADEKEVKYQMDDAQGYAVVVWTYNKDQDMCKMIFL